MGPLDFLFHISSFVAPALALGLALPLAGRVLLRQHRVAWSYRAQVALVTVAGVAALAAGLWVFGRDGKMATYAALVAACASAQWLLAGAWRR